MLIILSYCWVLTFLPWLKILSLGGAVLLEGKLFIGCGSLPLSAFSGLHGEEIG